MRYHSDASKNIPIGILQRTSSPLRPSCQDWEPRMILRSHVAPPVKCLSKSRDRISRASVLTRRNRTVPLDFESGSTSWAISPCLMCRAKMSAGVNPSRSAAVSRSTRCGGCSSQPRARIRCRAHSARTTVSCSVRSNDRQALSPLTFHPPEDREGKDVQFRRRPTSRAPPERCRRKHLRVPPSPNDDMLDVDPSHPQVAVPKPLLPRVPARKEPYPVAQQRTVVPQVVTRAQSNDGAMWDNHQYRLVGHPNYRIFYKRMDLPAHRPGRHLVLVRTKNHPIEPGCQTNDEPSGRLPRVKQGMVTSLRKALKCSSPNGCTDPLLSEPGDVLWVISDQTETERHGYARKQTWM